MKKFMSITLTALMLVSMSACSSNNTARNNNNYGMSQGQNNGSRVGYTSTTYYRDGTYVGRGNMRGNTNEVATVDIRNGRIVNIVLDQVDASGKIINSDGRTTSGANGIPSYGTGSGYGTGNYFPSGMGGVNGGTNGTTTGNATSDTIGNTTNNTTSSTGRSTTANDIMNSGMIGPTGMTGGITANYGTGNTYGTSGNTVTGSGYGTSGGYGDYRAGSGYGTLGYYGNYGTGSGYGVGTNNDYGTPSGTGTTNLSTLKRELVNSMIQAQSTNVIINYSSYNDAISNWKVAVQRALDQARK